RFSRDWSSDVCSSDLQSCMELCTARRSTGFVDSSHHPTTGIFRCGSSWLWRHLFVAAGVAVDLGYTDVPSPRNCGGVWWAIAYRSEERRVGRERMRGW